MVYQIKSVLPAANEGYSMDFLTTIYFNLYDKGYNSTILFFYLNGKMYDREGFLAKIGRQYVVVLCTQFVCYLFSHYT